MKGESGSEMKPSPTKQPSLATRVIELVENARRNVAAVANVAQVYTNYEIGRQIVEEEQGGKCRADYGKKIIADLSAKLTARFGRGWKTSNLEYMRKFYLMYSSRTISQTPFGKSEDDEKSAIPLRIFPDADDLVNNVYQIPKFSLSWSHYLKLMRIDDPDERRFYEIEAAENKWSLKELQRQFDSALYQRLALSKDKDKVRDLAKRGQVIEKPEDLVKDPYILEFLGLPEQAAYTESELEQQIIDHLRDFLLELGKGFAFIGRQVRMTFNEHHFWIDLVFYNRLLRCFVLLDLKIGELKHQDIGQMQMYVNHYDRKVKLPDENKTIGILLCADKDDAIVEMTLPEGDRQIFASKYRTILPSKAQLKALLKASGQTTA